MDGWIYVYVYVYIYIYLRVDCGQYVVEQVDGGVLVARARQRHASLPKRGSGLKVPCSY